MPKTEKPLTPPDFSRCQAEKPGNGPFTMGGEIGDPRNGYRVRCRETSTVVATEKNPGKDGRRGSMSLCDSCRSVLVKQLGEDYASFVPIKLEDLLREAQKAYEKMSDREKLAHRREQYISWCFGEAQLEGQKITRQQVADVVDKLIEHRHIELKP